MKNNSNKKGFNPDELVADMLNSSSAEIVVGPDGTIMTKNEAIKKDVDGTRLLKQRVWGAARSNVEKLIAALDFRGKGKNSAGKDDAGKGRGAAKSEKSCKYSNARDECGEESEIDQFENDEEGEDYESAKNFKTTNSGKIAKGGKYANEDDAESMLSSSSAEIVVGPDGTIMTKNEAIKKDVDGTRLLKQRVWGAPDEPFEICPVSDCEYGFYSAVDEVCSSSGLSGTAVEIEGTLPAGEKTASSENAAAAAEFQDECRHSGQHYEFDVEECGGIFGDKPCESDILFMDARSVEKASRQAIDNAGLEEFRSGLHEAERAKVGGLITVFKEFMPSDRPRGKNKLTALTLEFDEESGRYTQAIFKPSAGSVKAVFYTDARLDVHESADAALKRNDGAVRKAVNGLEKAEIFICVSPAREFARSFKVCDRLEESIILKEIPVDIVTLSEDIFSRNKSILETVELRNKSVAMIGLGSMGSSIALELARSGVGNFTLIDLDRVSAANVCRHACGVTEVGKFKSYAVRDRILKINPLATVTASISDLTEDLEFAIKLVQGCDLIIVTTDTLSSRRVSNYLGILMKAPVIFAGVFERAGGCRIFKMVPGTDCACMECHQIGTFDERPGAVTYSAAKDPRDLTIQPGLSVDISIAAELAAKMAIEELREDKSGAMPYDLIITRNYSPEAGVNEPVRFMCARNGNIKKNPDCPVCGENSVMEI